MCEAFRIRRSRGSLYLSKHSRVISSAMSFGKPRRSEVMKAVGLPSGDWRATHLTKMFCRTPSDGLVRAP